MNISTVIFEKPRKTLKIADVVNLGPTISAHRFFPDMRFVVVNFKCSLVFILELGYLITHYSVPTGV